jgi:hypothetical protein
MLTKFTVFFTKSTILPTEVVMELNDCINNLTQSLLQQGDDMRKRGSGAPPGATKDTTTSVSSDSRSSV